LFVAGMSLSTYAAAVERTTDAERSYRAIRYSNDAATHLLAERWYGLVRLQEWTDASGRFKTRAKYVEHDPSLAWVKLRVIQGSGDERLVKDIQVAVEKLSPICKSRVRQIAVLSEKVAAAVTKEQEAETAEGDPGAGDAPIDSRDSFGREGDDRPSGGPPPGRDADLDRSGGGLESPDAAGDGRGGPPFAPPRPSGQPLPAMLPPVPGGAGLVLIGPAAEGGDPRTPADQPADGAGEPTPPAESRE
jgi:hypothetical protein